MSEQKFQVRDSPECGNNEFWRGRREAVSEKNRRKQINLSGGPVGPVPQKTVVEKAKKALDIASDK